MSVLLFDLDNTLYPQSLGVIERIDQRINEYLLHRVGIAADEVDTVRRRFWAEHGTTLRGLMVRHSVDADDYLEYVHDVALDDLLKPDRELALLLDRLPGRKLVFSNASRVHVSRVLTALGLDHSFEAVIGLEDLAYVPKPSPEAFRVVLDRCGAEPGICSLIDDLKPNLAAAKRLGMRTIWIGDETSPPDETIDHVVARVHAIEAILGSAVAAALDRV